MATKRGQRKQESLEPRASLPRRGVSLLSLWDCLFQKGGSLIGAPKPLYIEDAVKLLAQALQAPAPPELFATWALLQELNGRFGRGLGMGDSSKSPGRRMSFVEKCKGPERCCWERRSL